MTVDIESVFNAVSKAKHLVYDSETTGLDWRTDKIVGHVLTWGPRPDETAYLPVAHTGGGNLPDGRKITRRIAKEVAKREDLSVGFHHAAFDLKFCNQVGIVWAGLLDDTMVNAALIDENAGRYSLEACAIREKVQAKKGTMLYKYLASKFGGKPIYTQMGNFHMLAGDDPLTVEYAAGDGTTTWQLEHKQWKHIKREGLTQVWGVERRLIKVLHETTMGGVRIDEEYARKLHKKLEGIIKKTMRQLPKDLNIRSRPQLIKLFTDKGLTDWPLTPKGAPSIKEPFLEKSELGTMILEARRWTNLQNSFLGPLLDKHLFRGKVHTDYNQLKSDEYGVVTGRLSSSQPNLQQVVKRRREIAELFRKIFIPDDGHEWHSYDYSQQEYRVFAHYTGAPRLVNGYLANPPIDFHQSIADMLGVERDPTAKRLNLGMLYGMGVPKLADSLNISVQEARKIIDRYHKEVPEIRGYLKDAESLAKQSGHVFTVLGRRRRFPDQRFAHKAGNSIIQGTSADITKLKMVEVHEYLKSEKSHARTILQVHDELDYSIPKGQHKTSTNIIEIMEAFGKEDIITLSLPMTVDHDTGPNWSVATFGKAS